MSIANNNHTENKKKKRVYFENLDALRFLCFFAVFLHHSFTTEYAYIKEHPVFKFATEDLFRNGNIGVNFFFVLSGFLITYLLIEEKRLNGQIDLKKFWLRRILRIWPLFYFCVFFGFFIFPLLKSFFGQTPNETASLIYYLSFLNNFDFIAAGLPDAAILGVLWSVAIEEQFYLLWPVILFMLPLKKYWIPFVLIIISSLIFRTFYDSYIMHEYHTLSCMGDLAVGALGAWLVLVFPKFKQTIAGLPKYQIILLYLIFAVCYFFRKELLYTNAYVRIFERLILSLIILLIILEQNYAQNSLFKLSKFKTFSKLGIISYGLYCLHFVGILIAMTLMKLMDWNTEWWQVVFIETLLALFITIVLSAISYRYFEKPFLKLKKKFAYITK